MDYIKFIAENENYRKDMITRLIYHSNKIEGTTLSLGETAVLLWEKNSKVKASAREVFDVVNHKRAIDYLLKTIDDPLSENIIKNIGIIINSSINDISGYRKTKIVIIGSKSIPAPPAQVPQLMYQVLEQYAHFVQDKTIAPVEREAWFHIQFEGIHPFEDGNGRTGRLLMLRGLLKNNIPPVIISSDERAHYIDVMNAKDKEALMKLISDACENEHERIDATV